MTILRTWVLDVGPRVEEKVRYKVPFYYFYGPLCYLAPKKEGVDLAFPKGYGLEDDDNLLQEKGRKQVRSRTFYSIAELEEYERPIRQLLNQAAILNEFLFKRKKRQAAPK